MTGFRILVEQLQHCRKNGHAMICRTRLQWVLLLLLFRYCCCCFFFTNCLNYVTIVSMPVSLGRTNISGEEVEKIS